MKGNDWNEQPAAEENIEWIETQIKGSPVYSYQLKGLRLKIIDLHNKIAELNLKSQQLVQMTENIIEECYKERHILIVNSLNDVDVECSCGGYKNIFTGQKTKEQVEEEFKSHLEYYKGD